MRHGVTLILGDGIGPEVVRSAVQAIEATGVDIDWDLQTVGAAAVESDGTPVPQRVIDSISATGVALKGPVARAVTVNRPLRAALGLYLGIRPCRSFPGVEVPFRDTDVVVARMTDDDVYAGIEFEAGSAAADDLTRLIAGATGAEVPPDAGYTIKPISRARSERAARAAFDYARGRGRRKVTVVHKATVMRATDGVFVDAARDVAADYPEIEFEARLADAVCHDLVTHPGSLDVLFTPMLYGDLLSDLCAGLVGGLGLAPGAIVGDRCVVFEASHGTAPRLAGRGLANPMAAILSGASLLRELGEVDASQRLESAVAAVLADGRARTYDLRPGRDETAASSTGEVADAVVSALTS